MALLSTLDAKSYSEDLVAEIPEIPCPDPSCLGCLLRGHGWYRRYLGGARVRIRRTRCPCCGVTHALLPEDVCAYQDLTLSTLELALKAGSPTPAAQAVDGVGVAAVRRARRWLRSEVRSALDEPLSGVPQDLFDRFVGESPGKLLRLRRWLWSEFRVLLGGLRGLYLRGRPFLRLLYIDWQLLKTFRWLHSS